MLSMPCMKISRQVFTGFYRRARSRCAQLMGLRKKEMLVWGVTLGILLLFLASCGNQTITITKTENSQSVQAHVGDTIVLQLDENASTGYTWTVGQTDSTILALQSSKYTASGNVPGSGGTRVFTFLAKKSGMVHLQLKYWRSFVGDSSVVQRYSVTLEVQS
jgi:inhibitor of cysteine peptidase